MMEPHPQTGYTHPGGHTHPHLLGGSLDGPNGVQLRGSVVGEDKWRCGFFTYIQHL